jgi:hypothetical protein
LFVTRTENGPRSTSHHTAGANFRIPPTGRLYYQIHEGLRHNEVLRFVLQIAEVAVYAVFAEVFYDNSVDVAYLVETILLDVL